MIYHLSLDVAIRLVCCCRRRTSGGGRAGPGRGSLIRFDGFRVSPLTRDDGWKKKKKMPKQGTRKTFCPNKKKEIFLLFLMNRFDCLNVIQFRPIKKGNQEIKADDSLGFSQPFIPSGIRWDTVYEVYRPIIK